MKKILTYLLVLISSITAHSQIENGNSEGNSSKADSIVSGGTKGKTKKPTAPKSKCEDCLKADKSIPRVLEFDYETKQWNYAENIRICKIPYFLIPYKSQPVVTVMNVPGDLQVKIESQQIDVTPQNEGKSQKTKDKEDSLKREITKKEVRIESLKEKTEMLQDDSVFMSLWEAEKQTQLAELDSTINQLEAEIKLNQKNKVNDLETAVKKKRVDELREQRDRLQADTLTRKQFESEKRARISEINFAIMDLETEIDSVKQEVARISLKPTNYFQTVNMIDSDEVEFIVTINNKDGELIHKSTAYGKVFGGLKIDLSTGALFHTVVDRSFHYAPVGTDQSQIVKDRNKSKIRPVFPVVFTNIYWRTARPACIGISLGLGIDDSGQSGYYFGPSLILGDRQRAIFSLGGALRPADDLKGKYRNGQVFGTADAPDVSDLVESSFKLGLYLSLSYNLTTKVERRK